MAQFKDESGRTWTPLLTPGKARQLKDAGIDLLDVADGDLWRKMADDPCVMSTVLAEACREERAERQLSAEVFADLIAGKVADDAASALAEALIDYLPCGPRIRAVIKIRAELAKTAEVFKALIPLPVKPGDDTSPAPSGGPPVGSPEDMADATPSTL
jgi:hypothetical protein